MKKCRVGRCGQPPKVRGCCIKHYARLLRWGSFKLHKSGPKYAAGCRYCGKPRARGVKPRLCKVHYEEITQIKAHEYYRKNRKAYIERTRKWREKHPKRNAKLCRENYKKNKKRRLEYQRAYDMLKRYHLR